MRWEGRRIAAAQRGHRLLQDSNELSQCVSVRAFGSEIRAVQLRKIKRVKALAVLPQKLRRKQVVASEPEDRHDALGEEKCVVPLISDISGCDRRWPDHCYDPVDTLYRISDLLKERAATALHRCSVPPHLDSAVDKTAVQPLHERLVIRPSIGQENPWLSFAYGLSAQRGIASSAGGPLHPGKAAQAPSYPSLQIAPQFGRLGDR